MSTAVRSKPAAGSANSGGAPARRAVVRWAWRMFRREWRQQLTVLGLLTVAVAAAVAGMAFAADAPSSPDASFGTAGHMLVITGSKARLAEGISAASKAFGRIEVIYHAKAAIPGSVNSVDVRSERPGGEFSAPMLRLDVGHYPGPGQVAVTSGVAAIYQLRVGGVWRTGGGTLQVTGIVENPANLDDQFALIAPGQIRDVGQATVLFDATAQQLRGFRVSAGAQLTSRPQHDSGFPPAAVLVLDTIALSFVGLIAVATFTVLAQRRLRAFGMLAAVGATDRNIRLVLLANGAVVGCVAAVTGAAAGLASWAALVPRLEALVAHRIDTFSLPWWEIGAAIALAVATAVGAAWWPAWAASRVPVVAALSGRPPSPKQGRAFAALGAVLLAVGLGAIAMAHQGRVPPLIIVGLVLTATGVLLVGPLAISGVVAQAGHAPVSIRLALRDLSRYRARSGAALAAISLVTGIVAAIAVSAAAAAQNEGSPGAVGWTNLPANQLMIYLSPDGPQGTPEVVPARTAEQLAQYQRDVTGLSAVLHGQAVLPLDAAIAAGMPVLQEGPVNGRPTTMLGKTQAGGGGGRQPVLAISQLYVATSAVLRFYHLDPAAISPATYILTARSGLTGAKILDFGAVVVGCKAAVSAQCGRPGVHPSRQAGGNGPDRRDLASPAIQVAGLPHYTSAPNTLLTSHAMAALNLRPLLAGWLIQTPAALTAAQVTRADHWAAANGLTVETTTGSPQASLASVSEKAIAVGVLAVLTVLAMTIGLIRSETANDVRVLSATGASGCTRRLLTGATAAALALLGGLLGIAAAYLGIIAWNRGVHSLASVPATKLAVLIVGIPLAALAAGWLLAGREPHGIDRHPLD